MDGATSANGLGGYEVGEVSDAVAFTTWQELFGTETPAENYDNSQVSLPPKIVPVSKKKKLVNLLKSKKEYNTNLEDKLDKVIDWMNELDERLNRMESGLDLLNIKFAENSRKISDGFKGLTKRHIQEQMLDTDTETSDDEKAIKIDKGIDPLENDMDIECLVGEGATIENPVAEKENVDTEEPVAEEETVKDTEEHVVEDTEDIEAVPEIVEEAVEPVAESNTIEEIESDEDPIAEEETLEAEEPVVEPETLEEAEEPVAEEETLEETEDPVAEPEILEDFEELLPEPGNIVEIIDEKKSSEEGKRKAGRGKGRGGGRGGSRGKNKGKRGRGKK
jgi:hypothetical protein